MVRPGGFTVVEAIVALTLIGIGVAGWVGTSTVAVQLSGASRRSVEADFAARSRAERLAGTPCPGLAGGVSGNETWSIATFGNGVRLIRVEVAYRAERMPRVATYELMVAC